VLREPHLRQGAKRPLPPARRLFLPERGLPERAIDRAPNVGRARDTGIAGPQTHERGETNRLRAGLEARDIANTRPLAAFRKELKRARQ